jgi:hypothetical protein
MAKGSPKVAKVIAKLNYVSMYDVADLKANRNGFQELMPGLHTVSILGHSQIRGPMHAAWSYTCCDLLFACI